MANINISIPGQPIAKARPRFARRGKFVTTYSPQATEEGLWIMTAREQIQKAGVFFNGDIYLEVEFYLKRPKSHFNKKGILKPSAPISPTGKPDLSNMLKFIEDVLNECFVWRDDSQIVGVEARKKYGATPITEVFISDEPRF